MVFFRKRFSAILAAGLAVAFHRTDAPEAAASVSLVQLIAAPRAWNGKPVRVIGFLRLEFEGDALYQHEEDFIHKISANAVSVDLAKEFPERAKLGMNYVLIEGIFTASDSRDAAAFAGKINQIRRAEIWSARTVINPDD